MLQKMEKGSAPSLLWQIKRKNGTHILRTDGILSVCHGKNNWKVDDKSLIVCYAISIFRKEIHMTNKLKVGIVGAHRGSSYFQPFGAIVETDVTAVCDINETTLQNVAERFNVPHRFTDYTEMLDAVDLVVLATPENLHVPQSIEALAAGKHVISEVTAAVKLEDVMISFGQFVSHLPSIRWLKTPAIPSQMC